MTRLDKYLYEKKFVNTRTRAQNLIELGKVTVNGKTCIKSSLDVSESDKIELNENYEASLAAIKLEKAINEFKPDIKDKICLDLGAANGGFTEKLLQNGAQKIYALDIGKCALPENLLYNKKIVVVEKINARNIERHNFSEKIDFVTCDLSFISLKLILPVVYNLLDYGGEGIFLIKPQFEIGKKDIPKSGIVKDERKRLKIVEDISVFAKNTGFKILGMTSAPHPFENKNQEYLIYLSK